MCFSRIALKWCCCFPWLRFLENPVEKQMEHVFSGRFNISKRTGNAAGMFQKEISLVSTFLLKKLIPFQALAKYITQISRVRGPHFLCARTINEGKKRIYVNEDS